MSYFLLPNISSPITEDDILIVNDNCKIKISKSLSNYLNSMKTQIDNYSLLWDSYKKFTNPYEYIHSIIPFTKISISKFKPLSRSFYKFVEIYNLLNLEFMQNSITTFHLAEGPGGFIEAIQYLRDNNTDIYYGMTLINDDENVPGWKKSKHFLSKSSNVKLVYGSDNTGNILNVDNLWYCYNNYKQSINLITGDGGIDYSIDFNQQEKLSINLIFAQICFAIAMQKKGGTFILKLFDIFTNPTINLVYLLSSLYDKTYIIKPHTSRAANSERYIVCKNFRLENTYDLIVKLSTIYPFINTDQYISKFLNFSIPYLYINKLEDINAIIGQQQLENILNTLHLLDNNKPDKLDAIKKNNIQKCMQWCIKYKIPYNKNVQQLNVFLPSP